MGRDLGLVFKLSVACWDSIGFWISPPRLEPLGSCLRGNDRVVVRQWGGRFTLDEHTNRPTVLSKIGFFLFLAINKSNHKPPLDILDCLRVSTQSGGTLPASDSRRGIS